MRTLVIVLVLFATVVWYRLLERRPFLRTWLVTGVIAGALAMTFLDTSRGDPGYLMSWDSLAMAVSLSLLATCLIRFFAWFYDPDRSPPVDPNRTSDMRNYDRHGRLSSDWNYGKPGPDWNPDLTPRE